MILELSLLFGIKSKIMTGFLRLKIVSDLRCERGDLSIEKVAVRVRNRGDHAPCLVPHARTDAHGVGSLTGQAVQLV